MSQPQRTHQSYTTTTTTTITTTAKNIYKKYKKKNLNVFLFYVLYFTLWDCVVLWLLCYVAVLLCACVGFGCILGKVVKKTIKKKFRMITFYGEMSLFESVHMWNCQFFVKFYM